MRMTPATADDIACWFIDTNYDGESFFVRLAYFTGAGDPYDKLKRALKAEIDEAAWTQRIQAVRHALTTHAKPATAADVAGQFIRANQANVAEPLNHIVDMGQARVRARMIRRDEGSHVGPVCSLFPRNCFFIESGSALAYQAWSGTVRFGPGSTATLLPAGHLNAIRCRISRGVAMNWNRSTKCDGTNFQPMGEKSDHRGKLETEHHGSS